MDAISIDPGSPVPPFEQLRSQVAARVARGELPPGVRLPTVRKAASELGLAVNTVARAYRELESDGVVVTEGRRGTFVASKLVDGPSDALGELREAVGAYVRVARRSGLTLPEAVRLLESGWADGCTYDEGPSPRW